MKSPNVQTRRAAICWRIWSEASKSIEDPLPVVKVSVSVWVSAILFYWRGLLLCPWYHSAGRLSIIWLGLLRDSYLIGNLELFAAAIALLILANPWPGIDHIIGIPFPGPQRKWHHLVPLILRIGLGSAMIYLAVYEKILNPHLSAQVVAQFRLDQVIPVQTAMWVLSAGIIEAVLGLLIITGFYTRVVVAIAFVVLSMSFFYFGEAVYSHITLFGIMSVLFATGNGRFHRHA